MDDDLDRVIADIVQPACFHDLQALVRERRRVDRDLGAHRPRRVAQAPARGVTVDRSGRAVEERAARRGQDERRDGRHRTRRPGIARSRSARSRSGGARRAGSRTDRPGPSPPRSAARARASGITRWPPATSVSLFAVATTLPAVSAARTGRRLTIPPVATTTRSTSSRVAISTRAASLAPATVTCRRWNRVGLLGEQRPVRPGGERRRPRTRPDGRPGRRASGVPIEPVEPRTATRRRRAGSPLSGRRRGHRAPATGAANRKESTRSRTPPWPGIRLPESFAPAARFSIDSARSPACAASAIERPDDQRCQRSLPEPHEDRER